MENQSHLAIASVPVQEWKEVYDEQQAFKNGTLFPELCLPFYVTEQEKALGKAAGTIVPGSHDDLLLRIQQTGFVLDDLRLYMDTHPDDEDGLKLLKLIVKQKKAMMKEFALKFYPLTMECMESIYEKDPESRCYCWAEGPIPWEGACK